MVLSDFLSRQNNNDSNPHETISISFNMHKVLQEEYYIVDSYLVQARSQTQLRGIKLPEVHGMRKNLDPNMKPDRQHANPIKGSAVKLCIGQGRASLKRKRSDPINHTINQPSELSQKIPGKTEIETEETNQAHSKDPMHIINNVDAGMTHAKPLIPDVPFHPGATYRPPPKAIRSNMPRSQESSQRSSSIENINPDINYLLGTGESYTLTAQHMQDSPIFFIQLNYVNNKKIRCCHPMQFPCHKVAHAGNSTSSSQFQPYCIAAFWATAVFLSANILIIS